MSIIVNFKKSKEKTPKLFYFPFYNNKTKKNQYVKTTHINLFLCYGYRRERFFSALLKTYNYEDTFFCYPTDENVFLFKKKNAQ